MRTKPGKTVTTPLERYRRRRRVSQTELAKKSGVSRRTISSIECGDPQRVQFAVAEKLSEFLGVEVQDLFHESDLTNRGRPSSATTPSQPPR